VQSKPTVSVTLCLPSTRLEMACRESCETTPTGISPVGKPGISIHLKTQPRLHLFLKRLGHDAVKLVQDLDSKLRIDTLGADEIVQGIRQ